jgi:hypothetical protein
MTGAPRVTFEIHALQAGKNWQLVEICDGEAAARAAAAQILKHGRCLAVRVIRDRLRADGEHSESIILEDVASASAEPDLSVSHVPDAAVCHTVSDLYGLPSRITIGRLLRKYLEHWVITPTELLYSHRQQKRFGDTGALLMSAIDLAARAQAARTGTSSTDRRAFLYLGWEKICGRARAASKIRGAATSGDGSFAGIVAAAATRPSQRNYLTQVLTVRELIYERTWLAKLVRLIAWLSEPDGRARAWVLDGCLADLFLSKGLVEDLLGPQPCLGEALSTLLRLSDGQAETPRGAPEVFGALNRLLGEGVLPETRDAIVSRVLRELSGAQPLNRHHGGGEMLQFQALALALVTPRAVIGGAATAEALTDRYCRILNTGTIHGAPRALRDIAAMMPDGCRRLHYLVTSHKLPYCMEQAEADIAAFVDGLNDPGPLFPPGLPMEDRLAAMTSVHRAILESRLPIDMRVEFDQRIDKLQSDLLIRSKVIERLDDPTSPLSVRATRLVMLCRPGVLIDGASARLARARVIQELRQPNFDAKFVGTITDPLQAKAALGDFYRLLVQGGF